MTEAHQPVSEYDRTRAVQALQVHVTTGLLDIEAYEERCNQALASDSLEAMNELFADLPLPHYDSDLTPYIPSDSMFVSPERQEDRPVDIRDHRIGNTALTHRKLRLIGWILALLWIPITDELISMILPSPMVASVLFTPLLIMVLYSIAIAPVKPRYRLLTDAQAQALAKGMKPPRQYPY